MAVFSLPSMVSFTMSSLIMKPWVDTCCCITSCFYERHLNHQPFPHHCHSILLRHEYHQPENSLLTHMLRGSRDMSRISGSSALVACIMCSIDWHWVTLTFDLACHWAFHWSKVWSKSRFKSKSKVISLSKRLRPNFRSKYRLRPKLSWTLV